MIGAMGGSLILAVTLGGDFDSLMAEGRTRIAAGACVEAALAFEAAASQVPDAEIAWVEAQTAWSCAGEYARSLAAGDRALAVNPDNAWALRGQGYARSMSGDLAGARTSYEAALKRRPDDAETKLGLGFVLSWLGESDAGHALCDAAATGLPAGDPRPAQCRAIYDPSLLWGASASFTFLDYMAPLLLSDLMSVSVTAGADWVDSGAFWLGVTLTQTSLGYGLDAIQQATPVVHGTLRSGGFAANLGAALVLSTDDTADRAGVGLLSFSYGDGGLGGTLGAAASLYGDGTHVGQVNARLDWAPASWLTLSLGPELQVITEGAGEDGDTEVLGSGALTITGHPHRRVALWATGLGGPRRRPVEDAGLSVWTNDDRTVGGYRVGLDWTPWDGVGFGAAFRHDFGDEQAGVSRDYQVLGGTIGVRLTFEEE